MAVKYCSKEEKIRRLISEGQEEADAQVLVDTVDRERAAFIRNYFHADWPNRSLYHAMVNTDARSEMVIQAILSFLQESAKGLGKLHSEKLQQRLVPKRVANP